MVGLAQPQLWHNQHHAIINATAQPWPRHNYGVWHSHGYGTMVALAQPWLWHNQHNTITNATAQPWPWHNYGVQNSCSYGITNTMP